MTGCFPTSIGTSAVKLEFGCNCPCHLTAWYGINPPSCICDCSYKTYDSSTINEKFNNVKPIRSFADDMLLEVNKKMTEELKQMEERIKRHITECKREIIKTIEDIFEIPKKETKNARKK
jgi:hypothetical protein